MRVSSAALFTLATLTASNVTQQAIAAPSNVPTQAENVNNIVVPTAEETPVQSEAISQPETITVEQFSQKSGFEDKGDREDTGDKGDPGDT
ncbi:hypothetical protein F7734_35400, partial [Scytonema sp. UIC 10036]|nr:hypothetical protein [Scytonema sp. UIC 10036]